MSAQEIDCEQLSEMSFDLTLNGLSLKVIMNALITYKQYEPDDCELCSQELDNLMGLFDEALEHAVGHTHEDNGHEPRRH